MKPIFHALPMMTAMLLAGCASAGAGDMAATPAAAPTATALLKKADGSEAGRAEAVQTAAGLKITIMATGIPSGAHAAHVHTTGACDAPEFKTAGGHWNPTSHQHGKNNPQGMHMGDMPNILIGADGSGELQFTIPGGTLSTGTGALLDADGAAVVIHAAPDDMMTDPTGNAGARLACGVFVAS